MTARHATLPPLVPPPSVPVPSVPPPPYIGHRGLAQNMNIFTIDTISYKENHLSTILSDPYKYMKNKTVEEIKRFTKVFVSDVIYTNDDARKKFSSMIFQRIENIILNEDLTNIVIMLVNEYFLPPNKGGEYHNLYNVVFWLLLGCHSLSDKSLDQSELNCDTLTRFCGLLARHITFIQMFVLSARYADMMTPGYLGNQGNSDKFIKTIIITDQK